MVRQSSIQLQQTRLSSTPGCTASQSSVINSNHEFYLSKSGFSFLLRMKRTMASPPVNNGPMLAKFGFSPEQYRAGGISRQYIGCMARSYWLGRYGNVLPIRLTAVPINFYTNEGYGRYHVTNCKCTGLLSFGP